jgi:hypothetical protein
MGRKLSQFPLLAAMDVPWSVRRELEKYLALIPARRLGNVIIAPSGYLIMGQQIFMNHRWQTNLPAPEGDGLKLGTQVVHGKLADFDWLAGEVCDRTFGQLEQRPLPFETMDDAVRHCHTDNGLVSPVFWRVYPAPAAKIFNEVTQPVSWNLHDLPNLPELGPANVQRFRGREVLRFWPVNKHD